MKRKPKPTVETTKHYEHQFRQAGWPWTPWRAAPLFDTLDQTRDSVRRAHGRFPDCAERIVEVITTRRVVK